MKNILTNLGFSPNEISVYEALVKLGGSSSAGDIIKISDLHRNIVYDVLAHLKNRGLVQEVQKNKKAFFTLRSPDHLTQKFEKQIKSTSELSKVLASLPNAFGHETTVYEGSTGWQEAWRGVMSRSKPKTTFATIGMAGDKWVKMMGDTFVDYEKWATDNKITDRIVAQQFLKEEIESHQSRKFRDIRYIPVDLAVHTTIEIFEDRCFFEIYDEPATLVEVKSQGLAITMRTYFELLWKMGIK